MSCKGDHFRREAKMNTDNQINYDDPQFVKVLKTCLKMEIKEAKEKLDAIMKDIKQKKEVTRTELNKRRQLKARIAMLEKINITLNESLTRLNENVAEISEIIELTKVNMDDQSKLNQIRTQEYEDLVAEYEEAWHTYRNMYEEFPLAKTRNTLKINLERLKIEYMIMEYKIKEIIKITKQREHINWIRTRSKIIEFAAAMVERANLDEKLTSLKADVDRCEKELQSVEIELQVYRNKEEDQRKLRKQKVLDMGPPKINHVPYREMYSSNQIHPKMRHQWAHEVLDDNISVNTLILEELCINENTVTLPEIIDVETIHDNDSKRTAVQVEETNTKNTIVTEKIETNVISVPLNAEARVEKMDNDVYMVIDDDTNIKDINQEEEIQILQESIKVRPSNYIKKNPVKHSAPTNAQDEIQAKRIRFQIENSNDSSSKIITPQPMDIVKEVNSKSSMSVPKIVNVETVNYNIVPISTSVHRPRSPSIISNNMFSSMHSLECCDSISSFEFMSKGALSHEGSLCNYKLSPTSDISAISNIYANKDIQISPPKCTVQQNNKNQSNDNTSPFTFNNLKKMKDKNFTLF
ncbi:uncharacterized protein LOC114929116 [Nylanderia fulva]|uniref:uncharacterized protein LOC114929116 n=1 Tax=Nylanderia fulva TaxID=613905 RepID=UPI0010FBBD1B|nr:uncharacterized protein LOC114929116 [Nylanderia fulva]